MKRNHAVVATIALGGVLLGAFPKRLGGQAGDLQTQTQTSPSLTNEHDIAARKEALLSDASDLDAMGKSLNGTELSAVLQLDQNAGQGVMELDATLWFLAIYDNMQCGPDREVAKEALKNRLGFYSHLLGLQADQAAGNLAFAKLPATAQAGARIKDQLRAAKAKLYEIAASLN
jgi:hypothetical protein